MADPSPSSFFTQGAGNPVQIINPKPSGFYTESAQFNLVYYGALTSAPTVDPFGNAVVAGAMYYNTTTQILYVYDGTAWHPYASTQATLEYVIDGGGAAPSPGTFAFLEVPYNATILQWTLVANISGSCSLDLQRTTYANFAPPTHPGASDSITGGNYPILSSQSKNQNTTLTGWNTTLSQGDILAVVVNSASTISRVTISIKITRR